MKSLTVGAKRKSSSWRQLYPFTSHWLELASARMHYLDEGTGTPLLMVHGNPTWSFFWRNLVVGLRETHRIVAPDHIGCGFSDKPQDYRYCLEQRIDDLVRLVEHLDLYDVTLLAHDWGGAIGLGSALRLPQRFSQIVLFNTGAFPPSFFPWRIRICRTPVLGEIAVRGFNAFVRSALWMAVENRNCLTREVRAGILAPYDSWRSRIGIDRFVRDIPATSEHPTWKTLRDIEGRLPELEDRQVHLIWGLKDWCFRTACLERFQQLFPEATVHKFPDAGHWVVEEKPKEILKVLKGVLSQ